MHQQDKAIIKALIPVAWADGVYADKEREMIDALLDAYDASDAEKAEVRAYAAERRTLEDIELQELSADDRRVVLQHAVLLSFADGHQAPDELRVLWQLASQLRISDDETHRLLATGAARAHKLVGLLDPSTAAAEAAR